MTYNDLQSALKSSYPHQVGCNMFLRQRAGMQLARMGLRKGKDFRRSTTKLSYSSDDKYFFKNELHAVEFRLWIPESIDIISKEKMNMLKNFINHKMKRFAYDLVSVQPIARDAGKIFTVGSKIP